MKNNFRPRSKFEEWVRSNGGTRTVAKRLACEQTTVQHWLAGRSSPSLHFASEILRLSKGKLSLEDILNGSKAS